MAVKLYLTPKHTHTYTTPKGDITEIGPKYFGFSQDLPAGWTCRDFNAKDYGGSNTCIVAGDVTPVEDAFIAGQLDTLALPDPALLDVNITAPEVALLTGYLDGVNIPADWVNPSSTWRATIKTIANLFIQAQAYFGASGELLEARALNEQFRNWPQANKDALEAVITRFGYNRAELRDNWTTRILLKWLADQWGETPVHFGPFITL